MRPTDSPVVASLPRLCFSAERSQRYCCIRAKAMPRLRQCLGKPEKPLPQLVHENTYFLRYLNYLDLFGRSRHVQALNSPNLRREERKPGECEGGCEEEGEEEGGCGKQNRSRRGGARNARAFVSLHPSPNFSIVLPILTRVLYQFIIPFHQFFQCFAMVLLDFSIITLMLPQCV